MRMFTLFYPPVPWQRSGHHGKKHYDRQKKLKDAYIHMIKPQLTPNFKPYATPIDVRFEFHMQIPKSLSNIKKEKLLGTFHYKKPDLSNLIKFVEDTFNGILWKDDAQISYMFATKKYGKEPKTMIYINETN